ncbi:MAG TPA: methyltransferase domain-containing protein [Jatrophihabitans sp.]|jgi:SAM-dependent methyltransferase|uniref:class I SAM-dependent methyltransferase n=1 Tax=Jatrophihabitans sp. TaxID=1932789 RepID=UPI002F0BACFE
MSYTNQIQAVRDYYLHDNNGEPSIYHIWERGAGRGDVTTPATSSAPYQQYIEDLLRGFLAESPDPGLLSIGCGNAMIEARIAADGYRVLGLDALEHAVELARAKGVDAVCADVLDWTPPPGPWTVLYADGSPGHLYDPDTGLQSLLERFKSWLPAGGALVLSNDPPRTDAELQENPKVPGYFWFSQAYLHQQVEKCGFGDVTSTAFTYQKPLSGPRDRIVVTARA